MNNSEVIKRLKNEEPFSLLSSEFDLRLLKNIYDKCIPFWSLEDRRKKFSTLGNVKFGRKFITVFHFNFGVNTETKIPYSNVIFKTK